MCIRDRIEGRLKLDQWESNEGQKRSKMGVVMETFQFVGNRDDSDSTNNSGAYEQSSPPMRQASAEKPAANEDFSADDDTLDEDVPF